MLSVACTNVFPYSCSHDPFDEVDRQAEKDAGTPKRTDLEDVEEWAKDDVSKYTFVPSE